MAGRPIITDKNRKKMKHFQYLPRFFKNLDPGLNQV
jgi:hypothetical protein